MKRQISAILSLFIIFSSFVFCTGVAAQTSDSSLIFSFNYAEKVNGTLDKKNTATLETTTLDGKKVLKITPNNVNPESGEIRLDCYRLSYSASLMKNARYMAVEYKYVCPEQYENVGKMSVWINKSGGAYTKTHTAYAINDIKANEWNFAVFDISTLQASVDDTEGNIFKQFHFWPYGKTVNPANMSTEQVMYIGDVSFHSYNSFGGQEFNVSFRKGYSELVGENPKSMKVRIGETYTLPEHGYEVENAEFLGWRYSVDKNLYPAGTVMTGIEQDVWFRAEFRDTAPEKDYKILEFTTYSTGSTNSKDNLTVTNTDFQGRNVVKAVPNPGGSTAAGSSMTIDGSKYAPAKVDLGEFRYLAVSYYIDGVLPKETYMRAYIIRRNNVLTESRTINSDAPLEAGKWSVALIDLSELEDLLVDGLTEHNLVQMHIYPFGNLKASVFDGKTAIYIDKLMFFKEKPNLSYYENYIKGYGDGTFRPYGNMTRAEACAIVSRVIAGGEEFVPTNKTTAFTDVTKTEWYHKYISHLESLGYLGNYGKEFNPEKYMTRAEYSELLYYVVEYGGKAVSAGNEAVTSENITPDASSEKLITRSQAVIMLNGISGRYGEKQTLSDDVRYFFVDVDENSIEYVDIAEAAFPHIENGGAWTHVTKAPTSVIEVDESIYDFDSGEEYVKYLDGVAKEKTEAIRSTPTSVEVIGTKYYVSNNGDDNNDGMSPEKAWKTIAKVNLEKPRMKPGDGVFFERGGLWRERLTGVTGVTYSAYGEGEKPKLYSSPENGADESKWTLMEGTDNIWIYATPLIDVGGIICDSGKVVGLKEVPDFFDGAFYVRGSSKTKPFDIKNELNENYEFFSEVYDVNNLATATGTLYFRCDEGNPGKLFRQIEFNIKGSTVQNGNAKNTHYDNLCIMYTGTHGISSGTTENLTVTNCDIGWIGGTIQRYVDGKAGRLGNGVEIYGGCDGYLVHNNYIYQCYDAGATHQLSKGGTNDISMYNATYSDNLIEDCIYSIEYFTGAADDEYTLRDGKNFVIKNNILRRSGYGWGNQRPDAHVSAHIKSWGHRNEYDKGTYVIENNIFDRGSWYLLHTSADYAGWCPIYNGNTYVQYVGGGLCQHKSLVLEYDSMAKQAVKYDLGDKNATVYYLPESYKHDGFLIRK